MRYEEVVPDLLQSVPEFRPTYDDLVSSFGESGVVGSHVVYGGLFRFLMQFIALEGGVEKQDGELVRRVLMVVELAASSIDDRLQDLVSVSFLEHLWQTAPSQQETIKSLLGPFSKKLLVLLESDRS